MRAAVLLLTGCSLPGRDGRPVEESPPTVEVVPWGPPSLQVQPDTIDFGLVDPGDHASRSVEIANVGGDDIVFAELRFADDDPTLDLDWAGSETLAAGASVDVSLTWSPLAAPDLENKLRIVSNDPVAPLIQVSLTGVNATPQIEVDPIAIDFGTVPIGRFTVQSIAIKNVGHADLEIESVSFVTNAPNELEYFAGPDPSDPTTAFTFPLVIPPGEDRGVTITYAPLDEIDDHGVLTVDSNDPFLPTVHAEQVGTGVPK